MKSIFALSLCCLLACQTQPVMPPTPLKAVTESVSKAPIIITKAVVKSVDFGIETWGQISCDVFDGQFSDAKTTSIVDRTTLDKLAQRIKLFKTPNKKVYLDTRAKIIIYYSDDTTATLCIGGSGMDYNGRMVEYDQETGEILNIHVY